MATGKALVCKLGQHIPIEGADRIVQVDMFGETIITQKGNEEGTVGLLFDMETCLTHEYASKNNMYRHSHLNEDKSVVGYLEDDRRIRPVRLKGVKCSALFMSIETLSFISSDMGKLPSIGSEIDSFDGETICEKYISKATRKASLGNKGGAVKQNLAPTFKEHIDTDQWARNKQKVQEGDLVIITEKLHGTSSRCGYLPTLQPKLNWWQNLISSISTLLQYGTWNSKQYDMFEYNFVVGSRRVVKSIGGNEAENKAHFYEEDLWTKISNEFFKDKLRKGETVYFEIVGYTPSGELIMPAVSNKKLEKFLSKEEYKEFIDKYGDITTFNYDCGMRPYEIFVYRITLSNEDGDSVDYSWDQVKRRCEQLGVNHVPELDKFQVRENGITLRDCDDIVEELTNDASRIFPSHIREGVCIRVENGNMIPLVMKNKSFVFKVLEGIVKDADTIDIEESN